jgi:hypothetical protein
MPLAEKEGFEPPVPWIQDNGFQDRRIRPLCHFSSLKIQDRRIRGGVYSAPAEPFLNFYKKTAAKIMFF